LLNGLPDVLNGALAGAADAAEPVDHPQDEEICTGECTVLDLALGPINLNLLGLEVNLDDCDNGPVLVCVSATASEGLLGGLLCAASPANGGNSSEALGVLEQLLDTINGRPGRCQPSRRSSRPSWSDRLASQLTGRLADGTLSDKELAKVTKTSSRCWR
jgi:hypothetical protein